MKNIPKRFFAFGCSFTNYIWPTWADAIGYDIPEYYNYGSSGSGNHFAFNHVSQADQCYKFNKDDLVIVCWTNVMREDRRINQDWLNSGNIYTQSYYDKNFVKKYCDQEGFFVRDCAYIKAVRDILNLSGCTWHFLSMVPIEKMFNQWNTEMNSSYNEVYKVYQDLFTDIRKSYFEVVFQNNWHSKSRPTTITDGKPQEELHPTPKEHVQYIDAVLPEIIISKESRSWMAKWNNKIWNNPVDIQNPEWKTEQQDFRNKKLKL